jgi:lysophospholipase L1-like esterase
VKKVKIKLFIPIILFLAMAGYAYNTQLQHTEIFMHFDGGKDNKTFIDETGRIWTGSNSIVQSNVSTPDDSVSSLLCNKSQYTFIETQDVSGLCPGIQDFTIEFQAKRNSINETQNIMGNGLDDGLIATSTFQLSFTNDNKMKLGVGNGTSYKIIFSNSAVTDTNWHFYTIQRNGQYIVFFKDGKFWGYNDIGSTFSLYNNSSPWVIGKAGGGEWNYFNGYIDEFKYSVGITRVNKTWMDWYAYGDSNTAANHIDLSPNDGSLCYIYTTIAHNPSLSADHNFDGYGMNSEWGIENIESHYPYPKNYLIMFGSNDMQTGISAASAAENVINIYNYVIAHGSRGLVVVPPMMKQDASEYHNITYQKQWLTDFENNLSSSVPYIKSYEILDSKPKNGVPDTINTSYYLSDGKHLNAAGQAALGNLIWEYLTNNLSDSSMLEAHH